MSRTEIMLRKALKKINELEKRIEKLEPPKREPVEVTRDGDGKLLDIHGNSDYGESDEEQHDFCEVPYEESEFLNGYDNIGDL